MLKLTVDYNPKINYTTGLNNVSLIRSVKIENNTENDFEDLFLEILLPEGISKRSFVKNISIPKHSYHIEEIYKKIDVDLDFLKRTEETGKYYFEINILNGEDLVSNNEFNFEVLPNNHWLGLSVQPDLIASFISPNNSHITRIISDAAEIARINNFSMSAYQTGLQGNVRKQINAVFEAIKKLEINYVSVPASFEEIGQKIRSIDEIIELKIANCLDIAVLVSSCLEAIGINPFIIFVKGHAFVGAWLDDQTCYESVIEDRSFFLKRLSSGVRELELFESVLLTSNDRYTYENAISIAQNHVENEENFIMGIDIKQARLSNVNPLPSFKNIEIQTAIETTTTDNSRVHINEVEFIKDDILLTDKSARDKMQLWESKLLDLTLRNNLLNFVPTARNVSLVENDLDILEDKLSTGAEFSIFAAPSFIELENKREKRFSYTRRFKGEYLEFMNNEIRNNRLVSLHSENELDRSLKMLYRESRMSIQENGSNALFLAIGFLKWYETDLSELPRFSPIVLYPIEIVRKGGGSGFRIRYTDEEVQINTTLLEKIRNDLEIEIPGLNPLPQDDNGIDVGFILNAMRAAVKDKKRWDVVEWSYLGIFSFNQFVMWEDLRTRTSDIIDNNNIKRLLGHQQEEDEQNSTNTPKPQPLFLMPADSSQAEAVKQSLKGESFVLYGPPGTGKSQTITNIIASSLYNGKSVLFVAEKMAALEVVQERLNSIGLSDFSLELHSNKSKKTEVLDKLGKTLNIETRGSIQGFDEDIEKYNSSRKEVKDLLMLVNETQENGLTLYEMINYFAGAFDEENIDVSQEVYSRFSETNAETWKTMVTELQIQAQMLPSIKNHSFKGINTISLKLKEKEEVLNLIPKIVDSVKDVIQVSRSFEEKEYLLGSKKELQSITNLMVKTVSEEPYFKSLFIDKKTDDFMKVTREIFELEAQRVNLLNVIETKVNSNILSENIPLIKHEWQSSQLTWVIPRLLKQKSILKILNMHKNLTKITKEEVTPLLNEIVKYNDICSKKDQILNENKPLIEESYTSSRFDFNDFKKVYDNSIQYMELSQQVINYNKRISNELFVSNYIERRSQYSSRKSEVLDLDNRLHKIEKLLVAFDLLCSSNFNQKNSINWLEDVLNRFNTMNDNIQQLDHWINYNRAKESLLSEGFEKFVVNYEENDGEYNLFESIIKNVSRRYVIDLIDSDKKMYDFSGVISSLKLNDLNRLKHQINNIFKEDLRERLANELPDSKFSANPNSEMGILKKAVGNGGRGISLRKLFSSAPNALRKISPCMLMSPISVAQYISPDSPKFDLIIFDEASQVETHRAIGAISRGSQVIMVGDPKQLPPTSFFKSSNEEESFEESDLPSILDEMISLSFNEYYLKWHYRSNHESLITFSNKTYYDDGLYTFPSVNNKEKKVSNVDVGGTFGVPKSGQNIEEASEILDYLKDLIVTQGSLERSIGIVTFNQPQRTLILDLIDEEIDKSPDFAAAVDSLPEELFVKNIENVQGDERDLIIFSIGFGPKENGRMSMNFGPINQKGGSKRLNVAVTRARDEMKLFSSFSSNMIDLNRISREGPRDLKNFLEYAQSNLSLHTQTLEKGTTKDALLIQLQDDLSKRGYESEISVGTSQFKVDLAIIDPDDSSKYIGAIMVDGGFTKEESLDDRVSTKAIMLKRLGWQVLNLWSLDWFINKDMCIDSILKSLNDSEADQELKTDNREITLEFEQTTNDRYYSFESSIDADYLKKVQSVLVEDFYECPDTFKLAKTILIEVVNKESPLIFDTLCRRVMMKFDLSVLTGKMRTHFYQIAGSANVYIDKNNTVWRDKASNETFDVFRIPGEKRDFLEIPSIEISNAIMYVLENQISLPKQEIQREVFKVFGFTMLGEKARSIVDQCIVNLSHDKIVLNDESYNILSSD